ncbi:hypothetical protein H0H92_006320, partial [Tricholoma furcatifolium]
MSDGDDSECSEDSQIAPLIAKLRLVLDDTNLYKRLLECSTSDAQRLLNSFQRLLDVPNLDATFRAILIAATSRISTRSGLFPTSYELQGVVQESPHPVDAGGIADIYKGSFQGQAVCLKAIRLYERKKIEYASKQLSKEAILWRQLSHPNILAIYGLSRLQERICIVAPWMENGDVNKYLTDKPATPRLPLAADVTSGLVYLHENCVIHGDLKGANVLIDGAGRARLSDFGLSAVSDPKILAWTSQSSNASKGGTVRWQAPELFDPKNDDLVKNSPASDVYAWGCVAYEVGFSNSVLAVLLIIGQLFTGEGPFSGMRDAAVILRVMSGEHPARPRPSSPPWAEWGLTEEIWLLMEWSWKMLPAERPASAEVLKHIQKMLTLDAFHRQRIASIEIQPVEVLDRILNLKSDIEQIYSVPKSDIPSLSDPTVAQDIADLNGCSREVPGLGPDAFGQKSVKAMQQIFFSQSGAESLRSMLSTKRDPQTNGNLTEDIIVLDRPGDLTKALRHVRQASGSLLALGTRRRPSPQSTPVESATVPVPVVLPFQHVASILSSQQVSNSIVQPAEGIQPKIRGPEGTKAIQDGWKLAPIRAATPPKPRVTAEGTPTPPISAATLPKTPISVATLPKAQISAASPPKMPESAMMIIHSSLMDSASELYQFRTKLASPFVSGELVNGEESGVNLNDLPSPVGNDSSAELVWVNRLNMKPQPGLSKQISLESLNDIAASEPAILWIYSVPQEIVNSVSDAEKRRQEAIYEFIYTERDFVRDMEYLRDTWIGRLKDSDIIPAERRTDFLAQVFWNLHDIIAVNTRLRDALNKRQKSYAVVERIGDVLLETVLHFGPFVQYGAHQIYGKYEFEKEKNANAAFAQFVETTERLPESRKLELNAYLRKPTTRLARYPLLLEIVLKHTPDDSQDKTTLPKVITIVRDFLRK